MQEKEVKEVMKEIEVASLTSLAFLTKYTIAPCASA